MIPDKSLQPLELGGNERKEFNDAVCGRKPQRRIRIFGPGASRSDYVLVAVRLQPTELAAKSPPRRVATAERISPAVESARSRCRLSGVVSCCSSRLVEL